MGDGTSSESYASLTIGQFNDANRTGDYREFLILIMHLLLAMEHQVVLEVML